MEEKRVDEEQRMDGEQSMDGMENAIAGESEEEKRDTVAAMKGNGEKDAVIEQVETKRDDLARGEEGKEEETASISEESEEGREPEADAEEQEGTEITVDGLTEKEAAEVRDTLKRFIKAYRDSGEEQETFEWLEKQLREELPEKPEEEIHAMKEEIVESIREYDTDFMDMTRVVESGRTKERWFADRIANAAKGVAVNNYGNYLNQINKTMEEANRQMLRTVLRQDGGISQCMNLDGFIAEQYQVNNFNAKAALQKSDYRAEVCVPKPGEGYGRNSFDVVIKNIKDNKIVHQYQFKFGKDANATNQLLKDGNYNNQRFVVPGEQVKEVQEAFPNKTVTDHIGGTEKVSIRSDALTKEDVKRMQTEVQETGELPRTDWNIYNTRKLAVNLGKQAGAAGVQAAIITTGFDLAGRVMKGEEIDGEEVVETALVTGVDAGVKAAAGGALTAASERGVLSIIPPGTPAGTIAKIACVGVENIKILWKAAKGEITMSEALEQMGRTSTAMTAGLCCAGVGAATGAAALSFIPVVGPIAGGLIGGMVGYMAGSKVGETVFNGVKKVAGRAREIVSSAWEGVKSVGRSLFEGIRSLLPW